jgi:hypothetical protein
MNVTENALSGVMPEEDAHPPGPVVSALASGGAYALLAASVA